MKEMFRAQQIAILTALFCPTVKCTFVFKKSCLDEKKTSNVREKCGIWRFELLDCKEPKYAVA